MKLKDVTRETKIADCDNLGPSAKSLCRYCSIETVGQLLDTPIEEVRALNYSSQTIKNLKRFVDDIRDVIDSKEIESSVFSDIQTMTMFGKTFVKVLGTINNATKNVKMYESERWICSEFVDFFLLYKNIVYDYIVFGNHGERDNYYYILRVIDK